MKNARDIIIKPIVSEKSYQINQSGNVYTFEVAKSATKHDIRNAIEEIFPETHVLSVNTMNRKGKVSRNRKSNRLISKPATKRAIVTLSEGEIDVLSN